MPQVNSTITPARIYAAIVLVLSAWVLHGFVLGLLVASVIAIASWPLYVRFSARLPVRMRGRTSAALFTCVVVALVLAPMLFASWALLSEGQGLVRELVAADRQGMPVPQWLASVPLLGAWAAARWQSELAHPGALLLWAQHADPKALVGWAQSLGQFAARHGLIMLFSILLLFFLYQQGDALARDARRVLREAIGESANRYLDIVTRAVSASVSSMLLVGLFDGVVTGVAFALAGAPRPAEWGAIIGALAAVPFLGYAGVAALALRLAIQGHAALAAFCLALGSLVLFIGDKIVRPSVAREGMHLPYVWVLMGCIGGFEVLGLVGLVIGPVVLALARELWDQRVREISRPAPAVHKVSIHRHLASHANQSLHLPRSSP
jgi:predicted PurR-regulated permease PerM